jgi:AcrR family transcriptional regulator
MRALARRDGVATTAYAYHFPDKATLLVAIATEGFRKLNEAFGAAVEITDRYQRFYKLGQCYLDFALNNPGHYQVMFWQPGMSAPPGFVPQCLPEDAQGKKTDSVLLSRPKPQSVANHSGHRCRPPASTSFR